MLRVVAGLGDGKGGGEGESCLTTRDQLIDWLTD